LKTAALTERIVLPNLNGLRFFAALSVIIYHVYGITVLNGHFGVVLFFTLSGFLITHLLLAEIDQTKTIDVAKFYLRRVLRIWPLYFLILFLAGVIFYCWYTAEDLQNYYHSLPYYIFFLPNLLFVLTGGVPLIAILWSIGSEEQFYLFWPLLMLNVSRNYLLYALIAIVLAFTLTPHVLDYLNAHKFNNNNTIKVIANLMQRMCFNAMATGAIMAVLFKKGSGLMKYFFHPVVQIGALIGVLGLWLSHTEFRYFNDEIYSILFVIVIANMALNKNNLVSLKHRVLEYLGKISYGLYVYHQVVAFLVFRFVWWLIPAATPGQPILKGIIVTLATIAVAGLSYEYFEKPFLRIKDRKYSVVHSGSN
jgi:peptidoglycan/LPS O-acetylase OafA/YrhL